MAEKRKLIIRHLLLLFFLIYIMFTLVSQQFKIAELARKDAELEAEKTALLQEREELKKEISLLHTDEYIEGIARDELGLVKPGEYIIKSSRSSKR